MSRKKRGGEIYEISVFYAGELTDERIEEIARELAESFGAISKTLIYYLFPYNMPH